MQKFLLAPGKSGFPVGLYQRRRQDQPNDKGDKKMAIRHNMIRTAGILALALAAGLFFLSAYTPSHETAIVSDQHNQHNNHSTDVTVTPPHLADTVADAANDLQALADMHTFAVLQFGNFVDVPDTFGSTSHYSPVWHLAWLDVVQNGHAIRIYHLTNKHDHEERLVVACDTADGSFTEWESMR
jgi:hypothetical protein